MAYNGWSNYETWCVHLWLSNDERSDELARDTVRHARSGNEDNAIRDLVRDEVPDLGASMFADLLGATLASVNWREVADAFKDEDEDTEDEDTEDENTEDEDAEDEDAEDEATA